MGRTPCCSHEELKKGAWTVQEDQKLIAYIQRHGTGSWRNLPHKAGLQRCGKSCRLRWINYLRPDIKRGQLSQEEEQTIIKLHAVLGNRWSRIAQHLPMRTDNEIKNYWNSYLKKYPKPIISTTSYSSNSEAIKTTELKSTDSCKVLNEPTSHQSQHRLSKSMSSSTQLLNKIASKIMGSGHLDAIKPCHPVCSGYNINNDSVTKTGIGLKKDNMMESHVPNLTSMSSHSLTSTQLLNKVASSLPHKVHGLEAARAVFSKLIREDAEKAETSDGSFNGNDQVETCLAVLSLSENGPHITRQIGPTYSPSPKLVFNEVTTPSCFSGVSSSYISFGNCAASGGGDGGDCSVSEINLVSSENCCVESSNSTSGFLYENAPAASAANHLIDYFIGTCEDEISKYIQYL